MAHLRRTRKLQIECSIEVTVTGGRVSDTDLAKWLEEAIRAYHTFRAGHVGITANGTITLPLLDLQ